MTSAILVLNIVTSRGARKMPDIIDVHAHIVFQDLNNQAGIHGPGAFEDSEGRKCFKIGEYVFKNLDYENSIFTDIDLRMDAMARLGVDLQVLSPNPLTMFHGIEADTAIVFCKKHNDLMSKTVIDNDKFLGLAALPIQDVEASCRELERVVRELGLSGACIGTDFPEGFDSAHLNQLYEKLVELDVPLFVHPASTDGRSGLRDPRLDSYNLSLSLGYAYEETLAVSQIIFGGVLSRFPELDICISHGGGCFSFLAEKMTKLAKLADPDFDYLGMVKNLWFDTHIEGHSAKTLLYEFADNQRIVFGTNFGGFDTPEIIHPDAATLSVNAKKLLRLL